MNTSDYGIAVVGMVGRFPGAPDLEQYWRNLRDGVESIEFFSDEELLAAGFSPALLARADYVKARAVLEGAELFDRAFFGISEAEAEILDPQQRVFLECAWEALENAGYDSERFDGRIGVYAGQTMSSYLIFNLLSNPELLGRVGSIPVLAGNDKDFLSTRVSYLLNLKGPSVSVQTACSTSLVAIHIACQSLLLGECDMALAGGVTIRSIQKSGYLYQANEIYSADGHCRAFDAKAGGTVPGSGVGVLVLKRLEEALADGDHIRAVIRGSAINNDGSVKVGFTAPGVDGEAEVVTEALALSRAAAETITYVETHGTGTALGDAIEVRALTQAFRSSTRAKNFCAIGTVKSNMGHTGASSGAAGLIKTILALEHRQLPPSLHFEEPNPEIDFADSPFYVNRELSEWKANGGPRRAGVSSFGIGGTNAHVIVEEAPPLDSAAPQKPWLLLPLSAKTDSALRAAASNLLQHLKSHPEVNIADVAYTLQVGRRAFNHRLALVCSSAEDAAAALGAEGSPRLLTYVKEADEPPVTFTFPGQGAEHVNMARELYELEPVFREQTDRCSELLAHTLGFDLRRVLYPARGEAEEAAERLKRDDVARPALFVVEYALAGLWAACGVRPQAMVGQGVGEYVAACLAGVFSLEDALKLVSGAGRQTPPAEDFTREARRMRLSPPQVPFISNATGDWIKAEQATAPDYWVAPPRQTARFAEAAAGLLKAPGRITLEVGPGRTLTTPPGHARPDGDDRQAAFTSLREPREGRSDYESFLNTLGRLWLRGAAVDWPALADGKRRRVPLPTYAFERTRSWVESRGPAL
ncbi:MAG TPA: type I polyketide synthase [Pyrinomonadaceae bacterium]